MTVQNEINLDGAIESLASQAVLDEFGVALHIDEAVVVRVEVEGEYVKVSYVVRTPLAGRVAERKAAIRRRIEEEINT